MWAPEHIQERLEEAADTLRAMKAERCFPGAYRSFWPDVVRNFWEAYDPDGERRPRWHPSSEAIGRMDEALVWVYRLPRQDRVIVWARALRIPYRRIGRHLGMDHKRVQRHERRVLTEICKVLNSLDPNAPEIVEILARAEVVPLDPAA